MTRLSGAGVVAVLLVLLTAGVVSAQTEELRIESTSAEQYPKVSLTVAAPRDLAGKDIPPSAFVVEERGQAREVDVVKLPNDTLEVVLVLDTSGSMLGTAMSQAKRAAANFADAMPPGVPIAVVGFGDEPRVVSRFTSERAETASAISELEATGETALYDAVVLAASQFSSDAGVRRAMVVLSDGEDTVSGANERQAARAVSRINAQLIAVTLETADGNRAGFKRLTATKRSRLVAATDPAALADAYEQIAAELINRYRVSFEATSHGETPVTVALSFDGTSVSAERPIVLPAAPVEAPATVKPKPAPLFRDGEVLTPTLLDDQRVLWAGAALLFLGLLVLALILTVPSPQRAQLMSSGLGRTAKSGAGRSTLTDLATSASAYAERKLEKGDRRSALNGALERAGLVLRPGEYVIVSAAAVLGSYAVGLALWSPLVGLLLGAIALFGSKLLLSFLHDRRRRKLADQLGDTLQLLAGSMRAGYSMLQAMDAVAAEAESPTSDEFKRVIVETRLGRDVGEALRAMGRRIDDEDLEWIIQAIEIHREVGGDLAEVLDTVSGTIRERAQVRRQVQSLSAEGKLSAFVLFGLPVVVGAMISFTNPGYIGELFKSTTGLVMVGMGLAAMAAGGLWMRHLIRFKY